MRYRENTRLDSSQMGSGGGPGAGGKIALGGGAGLIVVILALLLGLNPDVLGGLASGTEQPAQNATAYGQCRSTNDLAKDRDCRFVAYTNSIQAYWKTTYAEYLPTSVTTFSGGIATACGQASAEVGPFYCPVDQRVYLDVGFFDAVLERQLGAQSTDAVEAYVIAHEIGHHIQNLVGTMDRVNASRTATAGAGSPAVRLELQADCYAGAWFAHVADDPESPIAEVTRNDLLEALASAQAIGDDRIQAKTQGRVTPESWTHGSAAERQRWLTQGFQTGDPNQCDTFAAKDLG